MGAHYHDRLGEIARKQKQPPPSPQGHTAWDGSFVEWRKYGGIVTAYCTIGINKGDEYIFFDGEDYILNRHGPRCLKWWEKIKVSFLRRRARIVLCR